MGQRDLEVLEGAILEKKDVILGYNRSDNESFCGCSQIVVPSLVCTRLAVFGVFVDGGSH